jgi:putative methionine-R-sulfoxide reductase with GAF domain
VGDERLSLLLDLGLMLYREVVLDDLLQQIGRRVAAALGAERATVFVVDAATGELRSRIADLPELREIRLAPGQGVAGHVAQSGRPVLVEDTAKNPHWYPEVDRATGFHTRNMLAVPILDARRATQGVVQVINKVEGSFSGQDEAFLSVLAGQIALAFDWTTLRPDGAPRGVVVRGPTRLPPGRGCGCPMASPWMRPPNATPRLPSPTAEATRARPLAAWGWGGIPSPVKRIAWVKNDVAAKVRGKAP